MSFVVKTVGKNGQVSLGKQHAGRHVMVEEVEPGVWSIRAATVVPDNERWLHGADAKADLSAAIDHALSHPPSDAETASILNRLDDGEG